MEITGSNGKKLRAFLPTYNFYVRKQNKKSIFLLVNLVLKLQFTYCLLIKTPLLSEQYPKSYP